jgi:hypothetical protein
MQPHATALASAPLSGLAGGTSAARPARQVFRVGQPLLSPVHQLPSAVGHSLPSRLPSQDHSQATTLGDICQTCGQSLPSNLCQPQFDGTKPTRRDLLDPLIDQAIAVDGLDTPAVFISLRELALQGVTPFTGEVLAHTLFYTNNQGKVVRFTYSALRQRLVRRRRP